MADKLDAGDSFPRVTLRITDGGEMTLPDDIDTPLAVVLFYRGHW